MAKAGLCFFGTHKLRVVPGESRETLYLEMYMEVLVIGKSLHISDIA